jgi:hypothetical protein
MAQIKGVFHWYIYSKIDCNFLEGNIVKRKKICSILSSHHIPHSCQHLFIKEMESLGLVEVLDKQKLKVKKKCKFLGNKSDYFD